MMYSRSGVEVKTPNAAVTAILTGSGTRPTKKAAVCPFHSPPTIYAREVGSVRSPHHAKPRSIPLGGPLPLLCRLAWVGESMVALKILRWCLVYLSASMTLAVTGCANLGGVAHDPYVSNGAQDYPVTVFAARFAPEGDITVAVSQHNLSLGSHLPVTVETQASGKADGALKGAGRGAAECGLASLGAGPYFPFIFVPCAVLTVPVMAAVGTWQAAPKAQVDTVKQLSHADAQSAAQGAFAEKGRAYLAAMSDQAVILAPGDEAKDLDAATQQPEHPLHPKASGTVLELGLLEIRLTGSGKLDAPLCLHMTARGRKLAAGSGELISELEHARTVECRVAANWVKDDGVLLNTAIANGQQMLAEQLVDQLYLLYRPPSSRAGSDAKVRGVPDYVLAPLSPPAPDIYLDLRSLTKKARHIQGWGGMHFVDIDNLTPTLRWQAFPRPFDPNDDDYSHNTYEVRIYTGEVRVLGVAEPATLLQRAAALVEPHYSVATVLQPFSRYFWTVRARFSLNGVRRVTEWGGVYETAGGEVSPSYRFFYPFRTPQGGDQEDCWR